MTCFTFNLFVRLAGACATIGIAVASMPAWAQDDDAAPGGFYAAVGAGLNLPSSSTSQIINANNAGTSPGTVSFSPGYNFLGAFGYKWGSHIRTELEFDFRRADADKINGTTASGAQRAFGFSANVLYDINVSRVVVPYIGFGAGAALLHWGNVTSEYNFSGYHGSAAKPQLQVIGGVGFRLTPNTTLYADYRYIGIGSTNFEGSFGDVLHGHTDRSSNAMVGIRLFF